MKTVLIKYGELALKKSNRGHFEGVLVRNLKDRLEGLDDIVVKRERGRIFFEFDNYEFDEVIDRVKDVFGIVAFAPSIKVGNSIDEMNQATKQLVEESLKRGNYKTFKVETKRSNKGFEFKSPEVSRRVGGYINQTFENLKVDVHNPELVLHVEIRKETYVYGEEIKGHGGLPYGTGGRGMLLLSGGIDSPVAGWMMAKRGVIIEAVHFHTYPFTSQRATEKVLGLAKIVSNFTGKVRVHSINILEIYREIQEKCPEKHFTIHGRRFMTMIAERLAQKNACLSLITGENIAQVASQTMEGLIITNSSVTMPIFRPLLGFDKEDIIKISKKIDSYETSILPYEDCCTVFLPSKVDTRPKLEDIEEYESALDVEALIDAALENEEIYDITPESELTF